MQHVALRAPESALVRLGDAVALRGDLHHGLFLSEEDPVPRRARQVLPGGVHVVAKGDQDVPQVLALPGARPGRDGAVTDAQGRVGHEGCLGHGMRRAEAVALRAGAGHGVGGEGVGLEAWGSRRVHARPGIQHPQRVGQGGQGAHARAGAGRTPALLQGHGRRQPRDFVNLRGVALLDQPTRVGRDGFQEPALGLREDGAERQRRLSGAGDPGEGDDGVPGNVDVDVPEVVLPSPAHLHEARERRVPRCGRRSDPGRGGGVGVRARRLHSADSSPNVWADAGLEIVDLRGDAV